MLKLCMEMRLMVLALLTTVMIFNMASCCRGGSTRSSLDHGQSPEAVEQWYRNLPSAKEKTTKLHFYLHNVVNGDGLTTVQIAQARVTPDSTTKFGLGDIMDAPLTATPEPDSDLVGYAQGIFALSSQEEVSSLIILNFAFTNGEYNGSTLSALGRNPVDEKYREFPIIGGSGGFRLAQGAGTVQTYSSDSATGNEILACDFILLHYY